jgi:amidase
MLDIPSFLHRRPSRCEEEPVESKSFDSSTSTGEPLCRAMTAVVLESWDSHAWYESSDALADWLNARWAKTGYTISRETVHATLLLYGRSTAKRGLVDPLDGAFYR